MALMRSALSSRAWLGILLVALIGAFGAGTYVGYQNRPEVLRVAGVVGVSLTPPAGSSTKPEIMLCMDDKGVQVPCIVPRSSTSSASLDSAADFSDFWKAWNIINERFVPTKKEYTTNQERVWGAIQGLAGSLGDPYTFFLPPQEKSLFEQDVRGAFGGVGMQIGMRDGVVTVIARLGHQ
jgi:C-terminal processing protease CtpA/Prc